MHAGNNNNNNGNSSAYVTLGIPFNLGELKLARPFYLRYDSKRRGMGRDT